MAAIRLPGRHSTWLFRRLPSKYFSALAFAPPASQYAFWFNLIAGLDVHVGAISLVGRD